MLHTVKNWKLRLVEMSAPHPPQHVVNRLLSEVVSRTQPLSNDPACLSPEAQLKGLYINYYLFIYLFIVGEQIKASTQN